MMSHLEHLGIDGLAPTENPILSGTGDVTRQEGGEVLICDAQHNAIVVDIADQWIRRVKHGGADAAAPGKGIPSSNDDRWYCLALHLVHEVAIGRRVFGLAIVDHGGCTD